MDRLVASLPSFCSILSSLAVHKLGKNAANEAMTVVCEPLMPDVVAPKGHHNNRSYVSSADLPSDSLHKNLARWAVTRRISKKHKTAKNWGGGGGGGGGGALAWVWALAQDNTVVSIEKV